MIAVAGVNDEKEYLVQSTVEDGEVHLVSSMMEEDDEKEHLVKSTTTVELNTTADIELCNLDDDFGGVRLRRAECIEDLPPLPEPDTKRMRSEVNRVAACEISI